MPPFTEILSAADGLSHGDAWRDLARRAEEPDPFAEIGFVGPASRRLARARALRIALVWRGPERLLLLAAVVLQPPTLGLGFARVWRCEQAALGAATFDREAMAPALQAFVGALGSAYPFAAGLVIPRVATDGALARAARALGGDRFAAFSPLRRAAFEFGGEAGKSRFDAPTALDAPWSATVAGLNVQLQVSFAAFGDASTRWETTFANDTASLDLVLYSGEQRTIHLPDIDPAAMGLAVHVGSAETPVGIEVEHNGGRLSQQWKGLSLTVPTRPAAIDEQFGAFKGTVG